MSPFMIRPFLLTTSMSFATVALAAAAFPPVSELDPALLMPADSERIEIAPDGNFLVDGKPRYLLGNILYSTPSLAETAHTPGYADEDAWIYETIPDRDYLQRLGFDTVGGEVSTSWMQEFRPEQSFYQGRRVNDWSLASRYWKSGLPTIVDFTCASWSHGGIRFKEGRAPSRAAIPEGGAGHFMPYSLVTPEGRALYVRMWRSGAEELRDHGVHPYAYELFNEPTYEDRSPEAHAAFAELLAREWNGDAAAMDRVWGSSYGSFEAAAAFKHPNECAGLGVAWLKFRERCFASGIRLGLETIRAVDPDARVCFQPLGISFGYVNVLEANRDCGIVMSPTGGRDAFDTMLLRAIADGRPIIDGETYLGHTRASHRAAILTQWSRGLNASYYFKWERRLWEPVMKQKNGPALLAEKFPWMALNPVCTPTEALAGLMDAKRDIVAMQDIFGPRDHGIPAAARAAVLYSQPTERLGVVAGHGNHTFTKANALALANDAHLVVDAVFEEQLPENRLDRYRLLVAAGVDATYPATIPALRRWVEAGGTLVLAQEALQLDEIARPATGDFPGISLGGPCKAEAQRFEFRGATYETVPYRETTFANGAGWRTLATLPGGHPALAERRLGKGCVYYLGVRFPNAGDEARLIAALASECGIRPICATLDPDTQSPVDGIEVQVARGADGAVGFVVCNRTLSARAVRFHPEGAEPKTHAESAEAAEGRALSERPDGLAPSWPERGSGGVEPPVLLDITRRVWLAPDPEGAFLLLLDPGNPVVLRSVPSSSPNGQAVLDQSGNPEGAEPPAPVESYAATLARLPAWLAERSPRATAKAFSVDPARIRFLDLREVANRSYGDSVAGDGKGGWTDQGENHLRNAPWGPTDCNGVPFDFIRPDQNEDRACVILRSTHQPYLPAAVRGIAANLRASSLYFLHAGAWLSGGREAFRYVVHYADGTSVAIPMLCQRDFGDWWVRNRQTSENTRCLPGWVNSEGRGFHVLRWANPYPEKTIASLDIESANTGTIPIIEAISAELAPADLRAETPFSGATRIAAWGGAKESHDDPAGGSEDRVPRPFGVLDFSDASPWASASFRWAEPYAPPADAARADLAFDLAAAPGAPLPPLQIALGGGYHALEPFLTPVSDGLWRASVPLDFAKDGLHAPLSSFSLQLRGALPDGAATRIALSAPRIILRDEPESPFALRRLSTNPWGGVEVRRLDDAIELAVSDVTKDWAGANLHLGVPAPLPGDAANVDLVFEVNGGRTPLGKFGTGGQTFQLALGYDLADGDSKSGPYIGPVIEDGVIDADRWSWQNARLPLRRLLPKGADATAVTGVTVQFRVLPATRAGLLVRRFRFEPASPEP